MKKTILFISALLLLMVAYSSQRRVKISTENAMDIPPEYVTVLPCSEWSKIEYTQDVPLPPGTTSWIMLDSDKGSCSVQIMGISREQFENYYKALTQYGYMEIERVDAGTKKDQYISIGTILSSESKCISLAYEGSTLILAIMNQAVDGSQNRFPQFSNITNVYVNSYASYEKDIGVNVVTELYVPQAKSVNPQFTRISGNVTVIFNGNTTMHYFGATADYAEAIASAVNTGIVGNHGDKGTIIVSGTAFSENAVAGGGAFIRSYEITIP